MRRLPAARLLISTALLVAIALGTWSPRAAAQSTPPAGPAMTPDEIAACLCQKEALEQQQSNAEVQGGLLQERQQELTNLDTQIKAQAARTPSSDQVGQQVLQDLIAQQIALRNLIQLQIRPAYTQQLNQLRTIIETYNAQCTGRPRYVLDVEKAQENLVCPKP
jgi:membrane-bound lytic murein transglycosylase